MNLEVTKFINVQIHREWIEEIINGREGGITAIRIWSRSMGMNRHNKYRIARGNSRSIVMNFSIMIWFNFMLMLTF